MVCVDCHTLMEKTTDRFQLAKVSEHTPFTNTKAQTEVCGQCHLQRKAQLMRSSHMPVREGKLTCTSCHNPHGTPNPAQLKQTSVNDNCYACHTERRGPFLHEHPPVIENCGNCHEPHGSVNDRLLKVTDPRLCTQCHGWRNIRSRHADEIRRSFSIGAAPIVTASPWLEPSVGKGVHEITDRESPMACQYAHRIVSSKLVLGLLLFCVSAAQAQIDIGNMIISGEAEVGGLPRHFDGEKAKFEEYRDIPESVVVPELQLFIGGKKEDFFLKFDATQVGRDDQNYKLRFGRYGLLDLEFEWDQIPICLALELPAHRTLEAMGAATTRSRSSRLRQRLRRTAQPRRCANS